MPKQFQLNNFHLKVLALFFMTLDHLGVVIVGELFPFSGWYMFLRVLGRIAFPLFAFMISEGMIHTRKPLIYISRLAIMGAAMAISILFIKTILGINVQAGNIFVDLTIGALVIYFLKSPKGWKLLSLIPIAYAFLSIFWRFPSYISADYGLYGLAMMVGFYLIRLLADFLSAQFAKNYSIDLEGFKLSGNYQKQENNYACIWLLSVNLIWYIIYVFIPQWGIGQVQTFSILAAVFIYLYNGKRGYNAKWFQYGSYLYYPLHFLILYGIYELLLII